MVLPHTAWTRGNFPEGKPTDTWRLPYSHTILRSALNNSANLLFTCWMFTVLETSVPGKQISAGPLNLPFTVVVCAISPRLANYYFSDLIQFFQSLLVIRKG